MNEPITITEESDGTFVVRDNGVPQHRWPSFEIAQRRVESMWRWDAQLAKVSA